MATRRKQRIALLDVNVLVALAWPNHVHHAVARRWFDENHASGWATTPVTESGFVRVSSNRAALATSTTPEIAHGLLRRMTRIRGHVFWADDVRFVFADPPTTEMPTSYRDVTDAHLVVLADRHDGCLTTFDTAVSRLLGTLPAETVQVLPAT